jgi:hypothetical protein
VHLSWSVDDPNDFWVRGTKVKVALTLYFKISLDIQALQMHCFWSEDDLNGFFGVKGSEVKITLTL